jgi:hypothetical protein
MRNAWIGVALVSAALAGCGGTPVTMTPDTGTDGGTTMPDAFMPPDDTGLPPVDTGARPDAARADANIQPYDGGPPAMCAGLAPLALTGFCGAYADAFVAWYDRCHLIGPRGAAALRAELVDGCDTSDLDAAITAGRTTYDGAAAACCFAHVTEDTSCYGAFGAGVDECNTYIVGTAPLGAACVTGGDCDENGYCHVTDTCPGTCTAFAADGEHCELGDIACRPNSFCDTGYGGASDLCVNRNGRAGMACNIEDGDGCEVGLTCADVDAMGDGTCRRFASRGGECTGDNVYCDFESGICDYDIVTETGLCIPAYAEGTMHCVLDFQCEGDLYCDGEDIRAMTYGTCRPRAGAGESCATATCIVGTTCLPSGICGATPAVGEGCTASSGCAGGSFCSTGTGTCTAGRPAGDTCTRNELCASGNCLAASHTCAPDCTP